MPPFPFVSRSESERREPEYPVLHFGSDQHSVEAEREMKMENHFTAVFEQDGPWWIGYVEELPGANTQGATLEEARENLKEAVAMVLEANRTLAEKDIAGRPVIKEELVIPAS